jgi:hypothetical protein
MILQACSELKLLETVVMVGLSPQNGHTVVGVVGMREGDVVPVARERERW